MKKARYNDYTSTLTVVSRTPEIAPAKEVLVQEKSMTPPTEEAVARLNAIAREYPFCAYIKQNNLFLL